ncbi:hypothetical protein [Kineosporia sp. R_H_3]|uniref:hypothetical protein n=1 Tax=Kineosporia sp. R_H_3 TaxID=1961848 RepID=UPI000B4BD6EC|nr:hypothetical protein [Kineosporia sp. R_H_3]
MSGPRFVLVSGVLASGARRTSWPDRSGLTGEPGSGGRWVAWRLLGRNNHELGRSAVVFPTAEHVVDDVTSVRAGADDLTVAMLADGVQAEWRWRLLLDGRVVAVSSRSYLRQRECHYSASMFRQALPASTVPVVVTGPAELTR